MKFPNRPQTSRRGKALPVLAILLALSGIIRPFTGTSLAFAQDNQKQVDPIVDNSASVLGVPFSEDAINTLLQAFQLREQELIENEIELELLREELDKTEAQISMKIDELTEIERKLASTLAIADSAAQDDLAQLTVVYENMKPRDTADLFAEMTPSFAAGFLGLMQAETAALVMNELSPDAAHAISIMLAGRNADAFNVE